MQILSNHISALNVRRNFRVFEEIWVEEHASDVRFKSGSGNMAISRMCNVSGHNYRNRSVILDVALGQISRSSGRIYSLSQVYHVSVYTVVKTILPVNGR